MQHPLLSMTIRVYRAVNSGKGPEFLAIIEGNHVGPFYGDTGVAARRAADDWRKAEVEKEMKRRAASEARAKAMADAREAKRAKAVSSGAAL